MTKKTTKIEYICVECGAILTAKNCRLSNKNISGFAERCVSCEQKRFEELAELQGRYHALYSACVAFDVPIIPLALDGVDFNTIDNAWLTYLNILSERGLDKKKDKQIGFADGVKTLWGLFGNKLGEPDLTKRIEAEKKQIANKPKVVGSELQRERWGTQPIYKGLNFTQELYDELDMLYENRAEGLKGITITPQIEYTLVTVAKSMAIYNHLLRIGNIQQAQNMWKTIDGMLASENLRKKDEKPVEALRIDALVVALEEAGLMKNGELLTYDELIEVMRDKFIKAPKYNYSLDVADQVILDIINSMRTNADLPTISDLPEDFAAVDEYCEFTSEETEREKENKRYLGITNVNMVKSDNK